MAFFGKKGGGEGRAKGRNLPDPKREATADIEIEKSAFERRAPECGAARQRKQGDSLS